MLPLILAASLALAEGFFPLSLSLPFSPSAPWPWLPAWLDPFEISGRGGHLGLPKATQKILGQGQEEGRQKGSHGSMDDSKYFLAALK